VSDDPTPAGHSSLHFDSVLIDEHRRLLGPEAARRLVDLFTSSLADRRTALHQALDAGDAPAVRKAAHGVKGLAASSGASLLAAAGAVVQHADEASIAELRVLVEHLDAMADVAVAGIAAAWGV
jgi:HPt (histidine-containing phosphotransfer) domain-containing protein